MVNKMIFADHRGLRDWLIQRVSAIILMAYTLFMLVYFATGKSLDYATWQTLFANPFFRMFSILATLSIIMHSWVGLWTVFTDYIKIIYLRFVLQVALLLLLFFYFVWAMEILWGI